MKKTLAFMVMALALLLTQCRKPSIEFPTPSVTTTVSMTITAGPGSKTDITTEGGIMWSANDRIYVGDGSKYVGYLSITSGVGNATGTFTGDVTATTGTHTFHFYYLGSAKDYSTELTTGESASTSVEVDFSSQNIYEDNNHKLKNASGQHVGYGKAENVNVEAGQPITGLQVSMKSKVAIAYFCFQKGEGESANPYTGALTLSGTNIYNKMTVKFNESDFDFTPVKDGNISLTNTTTHLKYAMLVPTGSTAEEILNFSGGSTGSTTLANGIEANKFYRIDGSMPIVVKVKGSFTVDEYGTTVEFSKGNLQYLGKSDGTGTWRFADNQWDYMGDGPSGSKPGNVDLTSLGYMAGMYNTGSGNAGGSETEADKAAARDLFGWGATGFQDTRSHVYQKNYQPYSTSTSEVSGGSSTNYYGYGPDYDATNMYGLTVAAKSDWGCLAIGGDPAGTWRTLMIGEWDYLLNITGRGRTDANRFAKAKVNGVCGMLIFPDGYNGGTAIGSITGVAAVNSTNASYPGSNIPTDTWISMETAGVVFLPAAGYRNENSLINVGGGGSYWSITPNGDYGSDGRAAYTMYFGSGSSSVLTYSDDRYYGFAVRLVR